MANDQIQAQRDSNFGSVMARLKDGVTIEKRSAIGLGGAYLVGRAMRSTLYGVQVFDVWGFGAIALVLIGAALLASFLPGWRASRVDPLVALRYE